eukprot:gb/GEZN01016834.1/.p1 GENE.gb/GEZN01016834.1/~~gb/GEZN01016834.1/.p1  ORF type:complete len:215 (-),score=14.70 gb/GEZN01016834.1/:181-762(-)
MASLPTGCQMSFCWSQDRLEQTFTPSFIQEIMAKRAQYMKVAKNLGLDAEKFIIYVSVVESRSWTDPTLMQSLTLNPVTEMFNHDPNKDTEVAINRFESDVLGGTSMPYSGDTLKPGDEILISYGEKNNGELLKQYGFTVPSNPYDQCKDLLKVFTDEYIRKNIQLSNGRACKRMDGKPARRRRRQRARPYRR